MRISDWSSDVCSSDLDNHRLLAFSMNIHNKLLFNYCLTWLLYVGSSSDRPRKPFLQLSSQSGLLKAACEGYGILQFPEEWIQIKKAPLVKIPLDLEYHTSEVNFIFEKKNAKSNKIITLYKYLFKCLNKNL